MKSIITIMGFMGSGKSTMGKLLAREWDFEFLDLDHVIESKYHLTIPRIFEKYGEAGFRKLESETLIEVIENQKKCVLSLGGGTPCFENNLLEIKKSTTSIYLKITPSELTNRLLRSPNPRPLVQNKSDIELRDYIKAELERREKFYDQADHVIASDCIQLSDLTAFINRPDN
jgi:shikimate kinase